jgi:MFS transporter, DHA2 family, multidrug resistance protein
MGEATGVPEARETVTERWVIVYVAGMLAFVAMLDMNIVNVALAEIGGSFGVAAPVAQWVMLAYQLAVVALLLPAGGWLDGAGLRPALLFSVGGFGLASLAAAAAPSIGVLIAARVVQGAFGAVLFVLMPVAAARSVRPEHRGRAMSVPATLGPLGAVTGPAVGGVLLDVLGWRAIFFVKLPVLALALVLAWRAAPSGGRLPRPDRRALADAGLVGTAVCLVLLAFTLAPSTPAWLALAPLAGIPLGLWLRGRNGSAFVATLREARLTGLAGAVLALAAGFAAMHYLVALHLQTGGGLSASTTGLTVIAFPLAMALTGQVGGRLADRFGARPLTIAGAALTTTGLLLLVLLGPQWTPADVMWRLAVAGAGMGLHGGPANALAVTRAGLARMARAGAGIQLARSLGFAMGPAIATAAGTLATGYGGVRAGLAAAVVAGCLAVALLASRATSATTTTTTS